MKKITLLLFFTLLSNFVCSQNIDIPDANFKNALISTGVDTNDDGEISISEAEAETYLEINGFSISSLEGIEYFVNLVVLGCSNNLLTELDLVNNESLDELFCDGNQLTSLDLSSFTYLYSLDCSNNPNLTSLELGGFIDYLSVNYTGLTEIDFGDLQVQYLNIRNNASLTYVKVGSYPYSNFHSGYIIDNPVLEIISFKNGEDNYSNFNNTFNICNNPSLTYVCADAFELDSWSYTDGPDQVTVYGVQDMVNNCGYSNVTVNSYCSFTPGGDFNIIEGDVTLDVTSNGCDASDIGFPNLNFSITNGSNTGNFISNASGSYTIPVENGSNSITPILENPNYFSVDPSNVTVDFPSDASPFVQDFCITPNGAFNDLEISLFPINAARPGFDAEYRLLYKNKGTTVLSGSIDLSYQNEIMDFLTALPVEDSQSGNMITWNFSDLNPFETRTIDFSMNINSPMETPPVNGDDVLSFTTTISSVATEETPQDNTFQLLQTVVNAFDPNDKTCLEGAVIAPEQAGEFVHYRIRFENTGTASAINVVIKDHIDRTKYDLSSLVPLDASHDYIARITDDADDYYVEFIFENINLPFDDANNDGYVVFKIRTLDTLVLGDTFENQAEIYFDFNFPIITNVAQTTIATLSTEDYAFSNNITLYPNPTKDVLYLESTHAISQISIYDISGRPIQKIAVVGSKMNIDISTESLSAGTYFIKIQSEDSETVKKFIKD